MVRNGNSSKNYDWLDTPKWFTDFKGVARVSKENYHNLATYWDDHPKEFLRGADVETASFAMHDALARSLIKPKENL